MVTDNCSVSARKGEPTDSLIRRFTRVVHRDGILKDYKLNVLLSREERANFKQFAALRRVRKKQKRVSSAMNSNN